jgi:hypothetical protein
MVRKMQARTPREENSTEEGARVRGTSLRLRSIQFNNAEKIEERLREVESYSI